MMKKEGHELSSLFKGLKGKLLKLLCDKLLTSNNKKQAKTVFKKETL